jgi:hypothetical protein
MQKVEDIYMRIWCVVMPVTGTVLIPSIQGTVPAYMMGFASVLFVFFRLRGGEVPQEVVGYLKALGAVVGLWLFLFVASQVTLLVSDRHDFAGVNLTEPDDPKIVLRTTIFTQSLYFFACVFVGLYFRYFFKESWMRYVFWGGYFLAGYGIYEWLYFLVFHQSGDFLVNRTFGEAQHLASWTQGISFGGLELVRIKSTLGEPTFFTSVCLPFLFLALDYRKTVLTWMLVFCALFSTSTACYICVSVCLLIKSFWTGKVNYRYLFLLGLVLLFLAGMATFFPENFNGLFGDKFSGDNYSGKSRLDSAAGLKALLETYSIPNWLFGIGFGCTYLSIFNGLAVNTGIVGLGVFCYLIFKPAIFLPIEPKSEGLKMAMIALIILSSLSLSELFIPTMWMFLALANRRLAQLKEERYRPYHPSPLAMEKLSAVGNRPAA